ncbi:mule transposase domain protein [Colletotrichum incanum]|nr:mule transposase domain protein [Colletotrichum incanum]
MAYLDWDRAEQERVDELVIAEEGENLFRNRKRGMGDIWKRVERDNAEQEALYAGKKPEECIVVKS